VVRYRIYVAPGYFSTVDGMEPVACVSAELQTYTLEGLGGNSVYAVAVVAEDALGQWNPAVHSVYAVSSSAQTFHLDLKAWLQGAYVPAVTGMSTAIRAHLPLVSPYAAARVQVSSIDPDVADWMLGALVSTNGVPVAAQSVWLRNDGAVVSPGHEQLLWMVPQNSRLHLVLKHRNHLAAMSAGPLGFTNGVVSFDLTTAPDKVLGGTNACVELEPGVWGLIAGDADGDGRITPVDREIVERQQGMRGYLNGDLNLDGVVDGNDE
jgi:hypothetical protein